MCNASLAIQLGEIEGGARSHQCRTCRDMTVPQGMSHFVHGDAFEAGFVKEMSASQTFHIDDDVAKTIRFISDLGLVRRRTVVDEADVRVSWTDRCDTMSHPRVPSKRALFDPRLLFCGKSVRAVDEISLAVDCSRGGTGNRESRDRSNHASSCEHRNSNFLTKSVHPERKC